jgi:putative endonuclease
MIYTGITNDINHRFAQHLDKKSFHTKRFSDLIFVYSESYNDKYSAAAREKQIKGWSRAKKQKLLDGKLGVNQCTEFVEVLLRNDEKLVSLLRA